ncbi:4'-phosphopantetheinyl transferase superfamily protein [Bacillus pseudomycoides]|uniref:4'-phosphopantetheinyl transferase family protein n=1 Tax=Bacillus pseudomycoides TaxID=64104 RepID=UPI001FB2DE58|nr:4'-phosphopantetheinyl transferase superfamily protein [Bacillus pseudomycoides]
MSIIDILSIKLPQGDYNQINEQLKSQFPWLITNDILALKRDIDQLRSFLGRLLLVYMLRKKALISSIGEVCILKNSSGKPYIKERPNIQFNISHSGQWVTCAVSNQNVGIDIEEIKPVDYRALLNYFLSSYEKNLFNYVLEENQLKYFFCIWTAKESYVKAIGLGLQIPLHSFSVVNNKIINNTHNSETQALFKIKTYSSLEGHILTACGRENCFPEDVSCIEFEHLINSMHIN